MRQNFAMSWKAETLYIANMERAAICILILITRFDLVNSLTTEELGSFHQDVKVAKII